MPRLSRDGRCGGAWRGLGTEPGGGPEAARGVSPFLCIGSACFTGSDGCSAAGSPSGGGGVCVFDSSRGCDSWTRSISRIAWRFFCPTSASNPPTSTGGNGCDGSNDPATHPPSSKGNRRTARTFDHLAGQVMARDVRLSAMVGIIAESRRQSCRKKSESRYIIIEEGRVNQTQCSAPI